MMQTEQEWTTYYTTMQIAKNLKTKDIRIALNQKQELKPEVVEAYIDTLAERGLKA